MKNSVAGSTENADGMAETYVSLLGRNSRARQVAKLVFDTFGQPPLPGARSTVAAARHVIYQAGSILIDLRMDAAKESVPAILTGQVLDTASLGKAVQNTPVKLQSSGGMRSVTMTNKFGEFYFEIPGAKADLVLTIGADDQAPVLIPLKFVEKGGTGVNK